METDPEKIINQARQHEARARAAEGMMVDIRLRNNDQFAKQAPPTPQSTFFARLTNVFHKPTKAKTNGFYTKEWVPLTSNEITALYEALAIVRNDNTNAARNLRAQVIVTPQEKPDKFGASY